MAVERDNLARPGVGNEGRSAVLEAAAVEFMEHGFAAASIDGIADRLGATKGLVYHYYRSKADLYLDVQREATETAIALVAPIAGGTGTPTERLHRMAVEHERIILGSFALQRVSAQGLERALPAAAGSGLTRVIELRDRYEQLFVDVIAEGVGSGEFREVDPKLLVKPFLGALNWTVYWYRPGTSTPEQDSALADEIATYALRGLLV